MHLRKNLLILLFMGATVLVHSQTKKELIAQVAFLESELAAAKDEIAVSRKNEASSMARVKAIESQLAGLRETNTTLLNNLNRITEESSKKTASISESLTNMQRTERQLRMISDALTRLDSTTLSVVTALKQTMGENARIGISNNAVLLSVDNSTLFGENDKNLQLTPEAADIIGKVAAILNKHPETRLQIESYANALDFNASPPTDNVQLSALRAVTVAASFRDTQGIAAERLVAVGKGIEGLSVETTTRFQIRPDYEAFFRSIKENLKN